MTSKDENYYISVELNRKRNEREDYLKKHYTPEQIQKIKEDEAKRVRDNWLDDY